MAGIFRRLPKLLENYLDKCLRAVLPNAMFHRSSRAGEMLFHKFI